MIELGRGHAISTASPDAYFARWIDHNTWPAWSPDTEWVRVDGPVQVGTRGVLKPKGAPKVKFFISACSPGREYTDTTLLPGARLVFQHTVESAASGSDLRVQITMRGPLTFLWSNIMGAGFRESAQADLDRLVRMVEQP
ncbi:MAG: SRPBCC family protein [Nocardioidaceae bacterium]